MKEIYNIPINGDEYAVGLEWEEVFISKSTNINNEIRSIAKRKNRDYGCKINKPNKLQIGLGRVNSKGLPAAACFVSKALSDTLFVKKLNNIDHWVCYLNSEGLVVDGKEGVFSREQLIRIIDELSVLDTLTISCSETDKLEIFNEEADDYVFNIIDFEDIVADNKKTSDDVVSLISKEGSVVKKLVLAMVVAGIAGGGYYFFFTDDQMYLDIVNQELSTPLKAKEEAFKKIEKENQSKLADQIYNNLGKKILKEKIETNIYTKQEIYNYMKDIYETYPLYFYEWEFDSIQFKKTDDNKDIKFSVVYKRIENSVGYYDELSEKAIELAKSKFKLYDVKAYSGDNNNNTVVIDHYFKKPVEIKDGESEVEVIAKLDAAKKKTEKDITRIKANISEQENKIINETGFIARKFGSDVQDATDEIEASVAKGVKMYDTLIKSYKNNGQVEVTIPESYYNGDKNEFLNMAQRNSFYQWRDEKKAIYLPPPPTDKKRLENFKPFVKVWNFNMNSLDYSTQGIESIKRAVDLLDKTDISIYTVNYKIDNESWNIKGELYEKN